jgi:predicted MFS family arabinose efflux permease
MKTIWHGNAVISPRRAHLTVFALSLAAFAFVTTELLPVGLLTVIADDLDRSQTAIGLLVTGYAFVVLVASVPLTRLTRRIPRRWRPPPSPRSPPAIRCWPAPAC